VVDLIRSRRVARQVLAENGMCWNNALSATFSNHDLLYVEGWAVALDFLVCEHGWCETEDGTIVEPTPAWVEPMETERRYYAIQRFSFNELSGMLMGDNELVPPFYRNGRPFTDFSQPEVRRVYRKVCIDTFGETEAEFYLAKLNKAYPNDET
jgi:hypothetical protein